MVDTEWQNRVTEKIDPFCEIFLETESIGDGYCHGQLINIVVREP